MGTRNSGRMEFNSDEGKVTSERLRLLEPMLSDREGMTCPSGGKEIISGRLRLFESILNLLEHRSFLSNFLDQLPRQWAM